MFQSNSKNVYIFLIRLKRCFYCQEFVYIYIYIYIYTAFCKVCQSYEMKCQSKSVPWFIAGNGKNNNLLSFIEEHITIVTAAALWCWRVTLFWKFKCLLQELLKKMTVSRTFPWKTGSFLLLLAIVALLSYDIKKHGSFHCKFWLCILVVTELP